MRGHHLPAGAIQVPCKLQVLEVFKKLGIKTVPVTLKGSPLAKAAIRIILGELELRLLRMGRTSSPDSFFCASPSCASEIRPLCWAVQAILAGLHVACL